MKQEILRLNCQKNIQNIDKIITKSLEFEVEWLKYKLDKFKIEKFFKNDYRKRIAEINIRLKKLKILIKAVIPVRKNSQRVINKNLRKFNKKNLLIYKINKLRKLNFLNEIIVNTDSDKAIDIAKKSKVSYWKRKAYYASSKCSNSKFWKHIAETTESEYIFFTNCTSPLVKIETYEDIFLKFKKNINNYDSINMTDIKQFIYLKNKLTNFDLTKSKPQNLPRMFSLNFAVNIITRSVLLKKKRLIGVKPLFYKLSEIEGLDIDTEYDFEDAQFLHRKSQRVFL